MKLNSKWIIVVPAGQWQCRGIECCQELGFKVLALDEDANAPGGLVADEFLKVDFSSTASLITQLRQTNFDFITTMTFCSDFGVIKAAEINEALNLYSRIDTSMALKLTNKKAQRGSFKEARISNLEFNTFKDKHNCLEALKSKVFPFVIKPVDAAGSRGVSIVRSTSDIEEAVSKAFESSKGKEVIVEGFISGIEFVVESFTHAGMSSHLGVFQKVKVSSDNQTVATQLHTPTVHEKFVEKAKQLAEEAIKSLCYTHGPSHIEVIVSEDGTGDIVEVAGRGGGFDVYYTLSYLCSGVDACYEQILQATDQKYNFNKKVEFLPCSLDFAPTEAGRVKNIVLPEELAQTPNVKVTLLKRVGDICKGPFDDGERLFSVITWGDSIDKLLELSKRIKEQIKFEVAK